jgi:hypothetical protein
MNSIVVRGPRHVHQLSVTAANGCLTGTGLLTQATARATRPRELTAQTAAAQCKTLSTVPYSRTGLPSPQTGVIARVNESAAQPGHTPAASSA